MKPNQIIKTQPNYITPLLLIVVIFILSCIATSCKTEKIVVPNHFNPNQKVTVYNQKKVKSLVKAKTLRKCYAYE